VSAELTRAPRGHIDIPEYLVPHKGVIAYGVTGDSMTGDAISDGDCLVVDPDARVRPGDIAVVHLTTASGVGGVVKHVWHRGPHLVLVSSNPAYPPLIVRAEDARIAGRVIGVYRICR
jgi:repressor LexA